jgi:hypothetical protein
MSDLLRVDFVVRHVGADKPYINDLEIVLHSHDQPIGVSLDVEYDAIVAKDAGGPVLGFNVLRALPPGFLRLSIPRPQRIFGVRVFLPK